MNALKYTLVCLTAALAMSCSRTPSSDNQAAQTENTYSYEAPLALTTKVLHQDTALRVYVQVEAKRVPAGYSAAQLISDYAFLYAVTPDFNSKELLIGKNMLLNEQNVQQTSPNTFAFFFSLPKFSNPTAVLQIQATDVKTGQKIPYVVPIQFAASRFSDTYAVYGKNPTIPLVKHYFYPNDTLQIRNTAGAAKELSVYRYRHEFDPALSPMATAGKNVPKTLEVDTSFTLPTNRLFVLTEPGLYFFREDTSEVDGMGVLIVDNRFPRITRPELLLKPLVYISTNSEIKEIVSTQAPKKTLDTYWLRLASNNETKARRSIRTYYRRVTQANQQFTTYKEGWKTDMGMVYIVFGKPDRVTRQREKIVWTYTQNANFSEINFTFVKRPNQFVEDHFELVRYVEYEPIWYPTVEEWRTGIVER